MIEQKSSAFFQYLLRRLEKVHMFVFGQHMSSTTRVFASSLSWSFFGGVVAAAVMLSINITFGRILGPVEYGKYGLVIAISSLMLIPMTAGLDTTLTHFIAKTKESIQRNMIFNSIWWIIIPLPLIITALLSLFISQLSSFFSTDKYVVVSGIVLGAVFTYKNFADAILKGVQFFKLQAKYRIWEVVVVFFCFLVVVVLLDNISYIHYFGIVMMGSVIYTTLVVIKFKKLWNKFTTQYTRQLIHYAKYVILGAISGVVFNSIDRLIINSYLGEEMLGIYVAYSTVSLMLVRTFATLFINVFFPFISSIVADKGILNKINKVSLLLFVPLVLVLFFILSLAIKLYGGAYPYDITLISLFSILSVVTLYSTVLWWLIASKGLGGIRFTALHGCVSGLVFLSLCFVFKDSLVLTQVLIFLVMALFYNIIVGNIYYGRFKQINQ